MIIVSLHSGNTSSAKSTITLESTKVGPEAIQFEVWSEQDANRVLSAILNKWMEEKL